MLFPIGHGILKKPFLINFQSFGDNKNKQKYIDKID